jgi:hypothetical protein
MSRMKKTPPIEIERLDPDIIERRGLLAAVAEAQREQRMISKQPTRVADYVVAADRSGNQ